MSWLSNFVRPKLQGLVRRSEPPDNLWDKCDKCGQMIFHRELEAALRVCTHCGHHMRLPVLRRLELLFDEGKYNRIELPKGEPWPITMPGPTNVCSAPAHYCHRLISWRRGPASFRVCA